MKQTRRFQVRSYLAFIRIIAVAGFFSLYWTMVHASPADAENKSSASALQVSDLPVGSSPTPLSFPHFPSPMHALIWRNWELIPASRIAAVIGTTEASVVDTGHSMGLSGPPPITPDQVMRSAVTVIRRNWHLLPYEQLLRLLDWTPEELAYALREDDFLYIKLGSLKPRCETIKYVEPDETARARAAEIAAYVTKNFPEGAGVPKEPLFQFVRELSEPATDSSSLLHTVVSQDKLSSAPRICYSYFALYGDPLLDAEADPYPDGLLARLAATGVNGVWLQGVLNRLAPFPWDETISKGWETRIQNLSRLVERASRHGIRVYIYMNEPRAMPLSFHEKHPGLKGIVENEYATLCTNVPAVQEWIANSMKSICRAVPDLGGFFTISASENLTHCWSHGGGGKCERCAGIGGAATISNLLKAMRAGMDATSSTARLIAWDWGWAPGWADEVVQQIPKTVSLMSVSEWDVPITRGGISSKVGEYSMSAMGPGPRALANWKAAREKDIPVMAKIQAGNTWELSAVPYIPICDTVAQHVARLRNENVRGLLLGWTLGGYPSPNLEVATLVSRTDMTPEDALSTVANRRFGNEKASAVVSAWKSFSKAFSEFPFHIGAVYNGPLQVGPANLLWEKPTGYRATMVGFPYDDLSAWRSIYPAEVYISQLKKVADGFDAARSELAKVAETGTPENNALTNELRIAEAAAIHFRSASAQARYIQLRDELLQEKQTTATQDTSRAQSERNEERKILLKEEMERAIRMKRLQESDSRLGFEASNQYYYTPLDLVEKAVSCDWLLKRTDGHEPGNSNRGKLPGDL